MLKRSLAEAKAHLSELVDQAEHKKRRILILRHGKPAAAIVPVEVATPRAGRPRAMSETEVREFFELAARCGDPSFPAVDDLLMGRR
jgi:prevent-host-death family protein